MGVKINLRRRKKNEHNQDGCSCPDNEENYNFSYKPKDQKLISILPSAIEEVTLNKGDYIEIIAGNNTSENNVIWGSDVFCINGLDKALQYLDANWVVNSETQKKWKLSWKKDLKSEEPIDLIVRYGYKTNVVINYQEPIDENNITHILCRKVKAKTMHVLGPREDDDQLPDYDFLSATFKLNEGEKIRGVGVRESRMKNSNISIESDVSGATFNMTRDGYIWVIKLIKVNNNTSCLPKKDSQKNFITIPKDAPKTNVTMGVDDSKPES